MSEFWHILLILGYFSTLIFSLFKQKNLLLDELKFLGWYLIIGLMAALWAHDRYTSNLYPPCEDCPVLDINTFGMLRQLWYAVVWPYIIAFIVLSLIRHLILLVIIWIKRKTSRSVGTAESFLEE